MQLWLKRNKFYLFILYEILHTYVYHKSFEGNFYIFNYFQNVFKNSFPTLVFINFYGFEVFISEF